MKSPAQRFGEWASFGIIATLGAWLLWWLGGYLISGIILVATFVLKTAMALICIVWVIGILVAFLELREDEGSHG